MRTKRKHPVSSRRKGFSTCNDQEKWGEAQEPARPPVTANGPGKAPPVRAELAPPTSRGNARPADSEEDAATPGLNAQASSRRLAPTQSAAASAIPVAPAPTLARPYPAPAPTRKSSRAREPAGPSADIAGGRCGGVASGERTWRTVRPLRQLRPRLPSRPRASARSARSYGTGRLFLTARDPHWLYAAWDLTAEQRREGPRTGAARAAHDSNARQPDRLGTRRRDKPDARIQELGLFPSREPRRATWRSSATTIGRDNGGRSPSPPRPSRLQNRSPKKPWWNSPPSARSHFEETLRGGPGSDD